MGKAVFKAGMVLLALGVISGCSNLGKPYSQIDPAGALEDTRKHNGYYSLKSVKPGTAKLVMRSDGDPKDVLFSISSDEAVCGGFKELGTTRDSGRGVIYPWIADLSEIGRRGPVGFVASDLTPGQTIVVRGHGSGVTTARFDRCGPRYSQFTPQENHAYLAQFTWTRKGCQQSIADVTDPDAPVPVGVALLFICEKP